MPKGHQQFSLSDTMKLSPLIVTLQILLGVNNQYLYQINQVPLFVLLSRQWNWCLKTYISRTNNKMAFFLFVNSSIVPLCSNTVSHFLQLSCPRGYSFWLTVYDNYFFTLAFDGDKTVLYGAQLISIRCLKMPQMFMVPFERKKKVCLGELKEGQCCAAISVSKLAKCQFC